MLRVLLLLGLFAAFFVATTVADCQTNLCDCNPVDNPEEVALLYQLCEYVNCMSTL